VTLRVRELLDAGLLVEMGETEQTGGRRARRVGFAPSTGAVLAIELGSKHARWRLADFAGAPLAGNAFPMVIEWGDEKVFKPVEAQVRQALDAWSCRSTWCVRAPLAFPGPSISPTARPGANELCQLGNGPVSSQLAKWVQGPIVVDNDVNVMAWGEYNSKWRRKHPRPAVIKHGSGIGCGIIANGQVYRATTGLPVSRPYRGN